MTADISSDPLDAETTMRTMLIHLTHGAESPERVPESRDLSELLDELEKWIQRTTLSELGAGLDIIRKAQAEKASARAAIESLFASLKGEVERATQGWTEASAALADYEVIREALSNARAELARLRDTELTAEEFKHVETVLGDASCGICQSLTAKLRSRYAKLRSRSQPPSPMTPER